MILVVGPDLSAIGKTRGVHANLGGSGRGPSRRTTKRRGAQRRRNRVVQIGHVTSLPRDPTVPAVWEVRNYNPASTMPAEIA